MWLAAIPQAGVFLWHWLMADETNGVLRVRNWDRFQHYKVGKLKGAPMWIRLYRDLLGNYDYQQLSERDRAALIGFYLIAAETDNEIPNDPEWIKRKLAIRRRPPIAELVSSGFLEHV